MSSKEAPRDPNSTAKAGKGRVIDNSGISEVKLHDIPTLRSSFASVNKPNSCWDEGYGSSASAHSYNKLVEEEEYVLYNIVRKPHVIGSSEAFVRAGPREFTHFDPVSVNAAIVTCGGLCPGLNNVIRELVRTLSFQYGVKKVIGIHGGFHGFKNDKDNLTLTPDTVADIHHQGGTMLAASRGGFDADIIINYLIVNHISQVYIIGGDGTHRGAYELSQECLKRKLNISVAGIPKTIDNDVDIIDRSFGFQTSVEIAQAAIMSAKVEAKCNYPNGIGIVKLMGRSSGLIAAHATLSSGDVDLCLVPEVDTPLEGDDSAIAFLKQRVEQQGHAVVVVAEGFGERIFGEGNEKDAGGNRKLPQIGNYIKDLIESYFKKNNTSATVKYIDPSYMIRSVPANASDSLYCMMLSQNAVHGAMTGYTAFSTGLVNNRVVYIPITRIIATSPRGLDPYGRTWERVLSLTRQPQSACNIKLNKFVHEVSIDNNIGSNNANHAPSTANAV